MFAVLNLFIGIIVDAMQNQADAERDEIIEANEDEHEELMLEIGALRAEISALRSETREALGKAPDG